MNQTKIVSTLGPASNSPEMIRELIKAGVNVFRLNFSHGNHELHAQTIQHILAANKELGTHVGMLADLQGPKIRLGEVENGMVEIAAGDIITFTTIPQVSTKDTFYITYPDLAQDLKPGDRLLIDDGKIELRALDTNGVDTARAKVIYGGEVKPKKGCNLPDTAISAPSLTDKDKEDLEFILTQPVNWIALSFVRSSDDIVHLKGIIDYKSHPAKVIAKIEKPEALEDIDEIIRVSDAIMVARGDLGVEVPFEQVPIIQKDLTRRCIAASKPVIIATQMMESMIENSSPTRAEVTDVGNAIYDSADALMLSGETATGKHPVKVIQTFKKVIQAIEEQVDSIYNKNHVPDPEDDAFLSNTICYSAVRIAKGIEAKAIIAMTKSGSTALTLSSYRPKAHIFAFSESASLRNTVSLVWGVRAFHYDNLASTNESIQHTHQILLKHGLIEHGDVVINTGSLPLNQQGKTNTIKISTV